MTSLFHPSDVAFARGWSRRAPGIDGWRIVLDREEAAQQVNVLPPGAEDPVFVITRPTVHVQVERRVRDGGEERLELVGEYPNLRAAVQALCPISEDDLQEIHEELERSFPRTRR